MSVTALPDGTTAGPDPDSGRMFDVPRLAVIVDDTDPTVVKLAFSGSVELDRGNAEQIRFYNQLVAGEEAELAVSVYVAGARLRHRRDSEGDVDAVVATKSVVVTEVYPAHAEG